MATSVEAPSAFDTHHDDVIHDAKVDFFGRRLATASSDRTIRIFQINQNQPETLMSILSGHEGPVWQVAWAHPKFGSILASCSYDGAVIIWQESKKTTNEMNNYIPRTDDKSHSLWTKLKTHRVHNSSVNSISFAPHEYGLHLACASSDGKISIISLSDSGEWTSQVFTAHQTGCNSVSWCPSPQSSSLLSLEFNCSKNSGAANGPMILASGGCDTFVKLWKFSSEECRWIQEASLQGHTDWVRDVCWRPNIGAIRHMLISCSQDSTVLVWQQNEQGVWMSQNLKSEPFADTIWRANFSEYGNLLAVSCGDNTVTIWREVPENGCWEQVGTVDENVTEAIKISEPLAVEPPESVPVPDLLYQQAGEVNQCTDTQSNYGYSGQEVHVFEPTVSGNEAAYYNQPSENHHAAEAELYNSDELEQSEHTIATSIEGNYPFEPITEVAQYQVEYPAEQAYEAPGQSYGVGTDVYVESTNELIEQQVQLTYEAQTDSQPEYGQYNQEAQYQQHNNFAYGNSGVTQSVEDYGQYQYDQSQYYQNNQQSVNYYDNVNLEQNNQCQTNFDHTQHPNEVNQPGSGLL